MLHLDDDLEQVRDASISEEIPLHKEPFIPVEDELGMHQYLKKFCYTKNPLYLLKTQQCLENLLQHLPVMMNVMVRLIKGTVYSSIIV